MDENNGLTVTTSLGSAIRSSTARPNTTTPNKSDCWTKRNKFVTTTGF